MQDGQQRRQVQTVCDPFFCKYWFYSSSAGLNLVHTHLLNSSTLSLIFWYDIYKYLRIKSLKEHKKTFLSFRSWKLIATSKFALYIATVRIVRRLSKGVIRFRWILIGAEAPDIPDIWVGSRNLPSGQIFLKMSALNLDRFQTDFQAGI